MATLLVRFHGAVSVDRMKYVVEQAGLGGEHISAKAGAVFGFTCQDTDTKAKLDLLLQNIEVETAEIEHDVPVLLFSDNGTPFYFCQPGVEAIRPLRNLVLRHGMPPESTTWHGDELPETKHFAVRARNPHHGEIIACGTCLLSTWNYAPAWRLRGMAVDARYQGEGVGRSFLRQLDMVLSQYKPNIVWCHARFNAVSFYEKNGWVVASDEFFDRDTGIPHRTMFHLIDRS